MGQPVNPPIIAFNRGLISPKALARVDLDKARLSASVMNNWLPKTQGAMILRPGTKHIGSSLNDTGAHFIPFIASTTSTAMLELTGNTMRVWVDDVLVSRTPVGSTVSSTDTGWENVSSGANLDATPVEVEVFPVFTRSSSYYWDKEQGGVKLTVSSDTYNSGDGGGRGCDLLSPDKHWVDTVNNSNTYPSWANVDFDTGDGTDTGKRVSITQYKLTEHHNSGGTSDMVRDWRILGGNYDTGTYATDTGKWEKLDQQVNITWSAGQSRTYTIPEADTGTATPYRHVRLYGYDTTNGLEMRIGRWQAWTLPSVQSTQFWESGGKLNFDAVSRGGRAEARKKVVVDTGDSNVEHGLKIHVDNGPLKMRVGSTAGDDDYIGEMTLATGYHDLALTPDGDFHISIHNESDVVRSISSIGLSDTGTIELTTPWATANLDDVRHDQSADVAFVDAANVKPHRIERRNSGRSWSVVEYNNYRGPFKSLATISAKLSLGSVKGNTTLTSSTPFFKTGHEGALFSIIHEGQGGEYFLGVIDEHTDPIKVSGLSDTGIGGLGERTINWVITGNAGDTGTYSGTLKLERSFDGPDNGYLEVQTVSGTNSYQDEADNVEVWYRIRQDTLVSGGSNIKLTYEGGFREGILKCTDFVDNQTMNCEVLEPFSDTGGSEDWVEGAWSGVKGFPTAVAFHEGRLFHAGRANVWGSVSDDYSNFSDLVVGDAGAIDRSLGSGPVDQITFLESMQRLVAGTAGGEITIRSSSLDEPLTPGNASARQFSTQGSSNLDSVKIDSRAFFTQRSGRKIFSIGFGQTTVTANDYDAQDLTLLTPDLLNAGVIDMAVQRQPDTRLHCVMNDGTVAILTYEPREEVLAWSTWSTDTGLDSKVEKAMVLPGTDEDEVYYHIKRTINGQTKRYLEKWAKESETTGDTGLTWLADCATSMTDTGRSNTVAVDHLIGAKVTAWANDTGQANNYGKDLSPDDTGGTQTLYTVDTGGDITLSESVHHAVAGLPYQADYRSTKLAYGAQLGTALAQWKRVEQLAFILHQTHNNAIYFGSDSGNLDPLPRVMDEGGSIDADKIMVEFDQMSIPFPGGWDTDSRVYVRAKSPRPATVMAAIPTITTNEKA